MININTSKRYMMKWRHVLKSTAGVGNAIQWTEEDKTGRGGIQTRTDEFVNKNEVTDSTILQMLISCPS